MSHRAPFEPRVGARINESLVDSAEARYLRQVSDQNRWDEAYRNGPPPWDPGPYDAHLPGVLERHAVQPGPCLDIACGSGKSLVYLAEQGFQAHGIDIAPTALSEAEALAKQSGVELELLLGRFPQDAPSGDWQRRFTFVSDRGFFHLLTQSEDRERYFDTLSRILSPGGLYYTLIAKKEGAQGSGGPPKWREDEVRRAVEPYLELRELSANIFKPWNPGSMPAWILVGEPT